MKIDLASFAKLISEKNTGLIIGNGFSMNFDKQFGDIYSCLKEASYLMGKVGEFKISPAAKPMTKVVIKENYLAVMKYIRVLNQEQIEEIFKDAVEFASFIIENPLILSFLNENKHLHRLTVGPDMLQITREISEVGKSKGFQYINIENWPILIWLYYLIEEHEEFKNYQKKSNKFVSVLIIGGKKTLSSFNSPNQVMEKSKFNGFATYYRLLMLTIIFGKGKAVSLKQLENIEGMSQDSLINWLQSFQEIFSLNYDRIVESLADIPVTHLHGKFQKSFQGYTFFQSFSLNYEGKQYFTSNIILGSYITNKVLDGLIQTVAMKNHPLTYIPTDPSKILGDKIKNSKLDHFVFFGLNPENDYHILSGIYFNCLQENISHVLLTFCYYDEKEVEAFTKIWHHVISSIYKGKKSFIPVTLNFVNSKEIVSTYFR